MHEAHVLLDGQRDVLRRELTRRQLAVTVDDAAATLVRFDNGALGTIEASRFAFGRKNYKQTARLLSGITDEVIRSTLAAFAGVKRRFTRAGEWQGVAVYDDYAHHPVEIAAVLRGAAHARGGLRRQRLRVQRGLQQCRRRHDDRQDVVEADLHRRPDLGQLGERRGALGDVGGVVGLGFGGFTALIRFTGAESNLLPLVTSRAATMLVVSLMDSDPPTIDPGSDQEAAAAKAVGSESRIGDGHTYAVTSASTDA